MTSSQISCPALLVSAPASGQGKTTATAALARWHRQQGRRVRVFKTGPDFLDPMILERASGHPVYQLDLWMGGEAHCRELLWQAAQEADLILVEGVMGLYDGMSSSADLAMRLGLPVMAVIDGSSMAQTFGAIAYGLAHYRPGLQFAGVLANRIGSETHAQMLRESLTEGLRWFGGLPRDDAMGMPSRHLGLVQADEVADIDARLDRAAEALGRLNPEMPEPVVFTRPALPESQTVRARSLEGVTVAVSRDEAFAFLYRANVDTLQALGARVVYFSPLHDQALPTADALYLTGGYPELHLSTLSGNTAMRGAIAAHQAQGKPIVAECGGMLALLDGLTDHSGQRAAMWGLVPGEASMQKRLVNLGMHSLTLPEGEVRGHTFHHARMESPLTPADRTQSQRFNGQPEAVYRIGRLHASFLHLYFPSNPSATAALFAPSH
ncbi:MAG: cobyrinate a,c-diamide synthase [Aquabacterium sp.]|uniref:cobyrinate a,c-diamide synthase n=1 Tax=Aquabacterium sp. TaxID=1872578 RepID=UPI002A371258|nr:cobyrinate a,c-diamide synthase [Aquabacterium sp.]MDX9844043.1 cobyrinate a,c-diamide synthase [Aquabacterium sp.]